MSATNPTGTKTVYLGKKTKKNRERMTVPVTSDPFAENYPYRYRVAAKFQNPDLESYLRNFAEDSAKAKQKKERKNRLKAEFADMAAHNMIPEEPDGSHSLRNSHEAVIYWMHAARYFGPPDLPSTHYRVGVIFGDTRCPSGGRSRISSNWGDWLVKTTYPYVEYSSEGGGKNGSKPCLKTFRPDGTRMSDGLDSGTILGQFTTGSNGERILNCSMVLITKTKPFKVIIGRPKDFLNVLFLDYLRANPVDLEGYPILRDMVSVAVPFSAIRGSNPANSEDDDFKIRFADPFNVATDIRRLIPPQCDVV